MATGFDIVIGADFLKWAVITVAVAAARNGTTVAAMAMAGDVQDYKSVV